MRLAIRLTHVALAAALGLACLAATAQDTSRERETLRRTQSALRAAQERQTALQAERDRLAADLAKAQQQHAADGAELEAARSQLRTLREREARVAGSLGSTQAELDHTKRSAAESRTALEAELQTSRAEAAEGRRVLAERTAANAAVTRLLEQSVAALDKAETDNARLYAVGTELLQAYRDKGVIDAATQRDPVLGFGDVQLENRAQDFRARLAKARLAPAARAASAGG